MITFYDSSDVKLIEIKLKKYLCVYAMIVLVIVFAHIVLISLFEQGEVFKFVFINAIIDIFGLGFVFFHYNTIFLPAKRRQRLTKKIHQKPFTVLNLNIHKKSSISLTYMNLECHEVETLDEMGQKRVFFIENIYNAYISEHIVMSLLITDGLIIGIKDVNYETKN